MHVTYCTLPATRPKELNLFMSCQTAATVTLNGCPGRRGASCAQMPVTTKAEGHPLRTDPESGHRRDTNVLFFPPFQNMVWSPSAPGGDKEKQSRFLMIKASNIPPAVSHRANICLHVLPPMTDAGCVFPNLGRLSKLWE